VIVVGDTIIGTLPTFVTVGEEFSQIVGIAKDSRGAQLLPRAEGDITVAV
jgi:hypothetical protein